MAIQGNSGGRDQNHMQYSAVLSSQWLSHVTDANSELCLLPVVEHAVQRGQTGAPASPPD